MPERRVFTQSNQIFTIRECNIVTPYFTYLKALVKGGYIVLSTLRRPNRRIGQQIQGAAYVFLIDLKDCH